MFARQPRPLGTALLPPNAQHGAQVEDLAELDLKLMAKSLRETWQRLRQDNLDRREQERAAVPTEERRNPPNPNATRVRWHELCLEQRAHGGSGARARSLA